MVDYKITLNPRPTDGLFHAIPVTSTGSAINPSDLYGTEIPSSVRAQLGWNEADHKPLTFATDHITKALAFALNKTQDHVIFNGIVPGTTYELVVMGNRDETMSRPREGAVFSFPKRNFVELPNASRQLVSPDPVPFSQAQKVMDIRDTSSLMQGGLQIFTLAETRQILTQQELLNKEIFTGKGDIYENMGRLIKDGRLVWENHSRGINPSPELRTMLKMDDCNPAQQAGSLVAPHEHKARKLQQPHTFA